jgi:hypothetical protein
LLLCACNSQSNWPQLVQFRFRLWFAAPSLNHPCQPPHVWFWSSMRPHVAVLQIRLHCPPPVAQWLMLRQCQSVCAWFSRLAHVSNILKLRSKRWFY